MSPRKEVRRVSLLHPLTDPWRKLIALGLAVPLWLFLDSQVTKTDTLKFDLRAVDAATSLEEPPRSPDREIVVRLPLADYSLVGFYAPDAPGVPLDQIDVRLAGPNSVMRRLRPNERFVVEFDPGRDTLRADGSFDFDLGRLQARDELFEQALRAMDPRRVTVRLEPNGSQPVTPLQPEYVRLELPDNVRIDPKTLTFNPRRLELRGRQKLLDELDLASKPFRVRLNAGARSARELRGQLQLLDEYVAQGLRIASDVVEVTVAVRPDFKPFELDVPVLLDTRLTTLSAADFEPVPPQRVTFRAADTLHNELLARTEEERRQWALENVRICALLPANTTLESIQPPVLTFFFVSTAPRVRGVDYDVTFLPFTVQARKKE